MRKIQALKNSSASLSAVIYRDLEWGEYVVKFHRSGVYQAHADYYTDDKLDALGTATHFVQAG